MLVFVSVVSYTGTHTHSWEHRNQKWGSAAVGLEGSVGEPEAT